MRAQDLLMSGTGWTDSTVRAAFPILLRRAMDGERIAYSGLCQLLGGGPRNYGLVAGKIGDICKAAGEEMAEDIPPLNAIIVNKSSGLPSRGVNEYLAAFFHRTSEEIKKLSQEERNVWARQATEKVFNYDGWDRLRTHLQLAPLSVDLGKPDRGKPISPPDLEHFSTAPESEAHKALKAWVAENPRLFRKYGDFQKGQLERTLSSGDRLDALFDDGGKWLAVEVKTQDAPDAELERGVYQCVKYRATLRAMQLAAATAPNGDSILVLERKPPEKVIQLASRLSVKFRTVSRSRKL